LGWLNPRPTESGSRTDSRVYVTAPALAGDLGTHGRSPAAFRLNLRSWLEFCFQAAEQRCWRIRILSRSAGGLRRGLSLRLRLRLLLSRRLRLWLGLGVRLGRSGFGAFAHFVLAAFAGRACGASNAETGAGVMDESAARQAGRTRHDRKNRAESLSHNPLTHSLNFAEIDEDAWVQHGTKKGRGPLICGLSLRKRQQMEGENRPEWRGESQEKRGRKKPVRRTCSSNAGPNSLARYDSSFLAFRAKPIVMRTNARTPRTSPSARASPTSISRIPV
jgi:hypothetical protein